MITTLLPFILIFTVYPPPATPLRCYHCSNPSRQIAQNLWIHKTQTCTRRKPMLCPPESVACVIVRVSHPLLSFTASGCSEDKFIGCDLHNLKHINTTMKRCQCSTSYCNKDLHMKGFHISVPTNSNTSSPLDLSNFTGDLIIPKPMKIVTNKTETTNNSNYHIQLLDQLNGDTKKDKDDEDLQKQRQHRLKMLKKQKEIEQRQQEKELLLSNAGNFYHFISFLIFTVILHLNFY